VGDGHHQFAHLEFQKIIRDDQRFDSLTRITTAGGYRLINGGLKVAGTPWLRLWAREHNVFRL
jgi:hypothetical protein